MIVQHRDQQTAPQWIRKALPCSVVVLVVGSLGTYLYFYCHFFLNTMEVRLL
jgi:hypothetical protein